MADLVAAAQTSLSAEDVMVRAVQFFTSEKWQPLTQSSRAATFQGRPPIPVGLLFLTIIGLFFFLVPGIIFYILFVHKVIQFQNLVVTANPVGTGCEVIVTYPKHAEKLVNRFIELLPAVISAS